MTNLLRFSFVTALTLMIGAATAGAAVPDGYYKSLEGKSGVALKQAVKDLIAPHTVIEYGTADPDNVFNPVEIATWTVFEESDTRVINGNTTWWDMYSTINKDIKGGHPGMNIEHSVANSWWGGKAGSKEAYCDLFHLNPSDAEANGKKSNNPLGEVATVSWTNTVTTMGSPKSGLGGGSTTVFEPHDVYKGDFARAYFYIFTIYDDIQWLEKYDWMYDVTSGLTLKAWAYDMLVNWAASDPVSHKEMERNEVIYKYQKNRNPFIDCPELIDHIWGSKQSEPFHYALYTPAGDDPDYPGWDEEPVEMVSGQWQPVATDEDINENFTYVILGAGKNRVMASTPVSNNNAMEVCIHTPATDLVSHPEILTGVPVEAAFVKLEKSGDNWVMAVYDSEDNFKGYLRHKTTSSNNVDLSQSSSQAGCPVSITAGKEATIVTFQDTGEYVLQYNENNSRFSSYKNTQYPILLYRPVDELYEDEEPEDPDQAGLGTGTVDTAPEVIYGIFDLQGRKVNSTGTRDLDNGIYIIVTNNGTRKIRK